MHLHPAAQPARAHPGRFLARQAGRDPRQRTISPSTKVGFESPRFWEEEGIYGGLAWTDRPNENIFYPSNGWHSDKGVLVTAYASGWTGPNHPAEFAAMSHEERFRVCRESVEVLHPGKSRLLARPVTVSWPLTPWSEGVGPIGPTFGGGPRRSAPRAAYEELLRPEGPIVFAGEHLSYVPFWQEGAALSAHAAMRVLTEQAARAGGGLIEAASAPSKRAWARHAAGIRRSHFSRGLMLKRA